MKLRLHLIAAVLSAVFLAAFWTSTLVAEAFLDAAAVVAVKQGIAYALIVFVPLIALTGATGFALGRGRPEALVVRKRARMPIIAINGIAVLVPAALFLYWRAQAGVFDTAFYAVQALELIAGAANLSLIALNFRAGLRLSRARRRSA